MFVRMYAGLSLAILIALSGSFALYHWQQQWRLQQQFEQVFAGPLQLILQAVDRHQGIKQSRWLGIAERLMGADLSVVDNLVHPLGYFSVIESNNGYQVQACDLKRCVSVRILSIREQHMRLSASLLLNALGRKKLDQYAGEIAALQKYFRVPVKLQSMSDLALEPQHISRLKRADVVVKHSHKGERNMMIYALIPGQQQVLVIGPVVDAQAIPSGLVLIVLGLTLLLVGGTGYVFIKRLESRIETIDSGVSRFAQQTHDLRLDDEHTDAVGRLSFNISSMSARIHQLLQAQQHLIRAVGHELRTPLSRSQFRLQGLQQHCQQQGETHLQGLKKDLKDMADLIEEVLAFDRGELDSGASEVALSSLLYDLQYANQQDFPAVDIQCSGPDDVRWFGNKNLINRVCQNLIQNACKYGAGQVVVDVEMSNDQLIIHIDDNGEGIPEAQRQEVFLPFARLEKSRNRSTGGVGLGLAIVHNLCQQGEIDIQLTDSALGGARFSVYLKQQKNGDLM